MLTLVQTFDRMCLWSNLAMGFWLLEKNFFIVASISVLVIGLFIFSVSSWFSIGRFYFSKNLSISSSLSILRGIYLLVLEFFCGPDANKSACNAGDPGSIPASAWSLREENGSSLVFLPGEFYGLRRLLDYSHRESNTTEWQTLHVIVSHDPLYFCIICYNFFSISNYTDLSLSPFFLDECS